MPRVAPEMPSLLARCAFEVFAERGFKEVTIDDIAAKAGVTKGSFYSHYRSKQEIILAACNHYYRANQQKVHARIAALTDPLEQLLSVLEFSVHSCVIDRANRMFTTEIFALALQDQAVRAGWAQFYDTVRQMYVGLVQAACVLGELSTPDPEAAVNLMLSAMEGVKLRATFEPHIAAPDEQAVIVAGLMQILGGTAIPAIRRT